MRVYLDTNIVVYLIEQPADLGPRAASRIAKLRADGDRLIVSDLTRLESRCKPIAENDAALLAYFDAFFRVTDVEVVPLTTGIVDRATEIRAKHRVKTPDALHLAAALEAGCDVFLTNDHRLSSFSELAIEVLP